MHVRYPIDYPNIAITFNFSFYIIFPWIIPLIHI